MQLTQRQLESIDVVVSLWTYRENGGWGYINQCVANSRDTKRDALLTKETRYVIDIKL